mmetsp:Transcript_11790/g.27488  ORF Transcript_11790/g.27488 Transcript_11790/m.27488 type:complete len:323 (-) Transcript_11790:500-1468(-)
MWQLEALSYPPRHVNLRLSSGGPCGRFAKNIPAGKARARWKELWVLRLLLLLLISPCSRPLLEAGLLVLEHHGGAELIDIKDKGSATEVGSTLPRSIDADQREQWHVDVANAADNETDPQEFAVLGEENALRARLADIANSAHNHRSLEALQGQRHSQGEEQPLSFNLSTKLRKRDNTAAHSVPFPEGCTIDAVARPVVWSMSAGRLAQLTGHQYLEGGSSKGVVEEQAIVSVPTPALLIPARLAVVEVLASEGRCAKPNRQARLEARTTDRKLGPLLLRHPHDGELIVAHSSIGNTKLPVPGGRSAVFCSMTWHSAGDGSC